MEIEIYDGTRFWRDLVPVAVANWNAALRSMGRNIFLDYQEIGISGPEYRVDGGIVLTDSLDMDPNLPREAEGNFTAVEGVWFRGYVHFFRPAVDTLNPGHPLAVVAHELGHCLMLPHPETLGLVGFTDTVMTPYSVLSQPTAWDATTCMPGYPLVNPPPKKKKKKRRRK